MPSVVQPEEFKTFSASSMLPEKVSFEGYQGSAVMPAPDKVSFEGVKGATQLPKKASFKGVKASVTLPPAVFEETMRDANIKVMFPSSAPLVTTPVMGVPMGAEKPYIGTKVKDSDKENL